MHGSAAGAGLGLVGASDLVVAGESTKFVMAYTGRRAHARRLVELVRAAPRRRPARARAHAHEPRAQRRRRPSTGARHQGRARRRRARRGGSARRRLAAGPRGALAAAKRLAAHQPRGHARDAPRAAKPTRSSRPRRPPTPTEGLARVRREARAEFRDYGPPRAVTTRRRALSELGVLLAHRSARPAWNSSMRARRPSSCAPRMRTASSAALRALPTPTVATGMPFGHLHDREQRVEPVELLAAAPARRSPGSGVSDAVMPGRWAAPPAPAMITRRPRMTALRGVLEHRGRGCGARRRCAPRAARRTRRACRSRRCITRDRSRSP